LKDEIRKRQSTGRMKKNTVTKFREKKE
jgi:hypothetical protein